jgi:hypothetical protein
MATYSIYKGNYIRPAKNVKIEEFPEAASQTFRIGDPLILQTTADKGHQVKIAAADPTLGTVVGFAMVARVRRREHEVSVAMFTADAEFVVCVQDTGVDRQRRYRRRVRHRRGCHQPDLASRPHRNHREDLPHHPRSARSRTAAAATACMVT